MCTYISTNLPGYYHLYIASLGKDKDNWIAVLPALDKKLDNSSIPHLSTPFARNHTRFESNIIPITKRLFVEEKYDDDIDDDDEYYASNIHLCWNQSKKILSLKNK